jgi:hypothetical protein
VFCNYTVFQTLLQDLDFMRASRLLALPIVLFTLGACASGATASGGTAAKASDATAISTAINAATAPFVGSRKSKKYYPSACNTVKLIAAADQIGFGSQKDAESAGFVKDLYSTDCQY